MSEMRKRGMGPAYLRLGPRTIRYRPEAVDAYEDQQENAPATSDFKAPASSADSVESAPNSRPGCTDTTGIGHTPV